MEILKIRHKMISYGFNDNGTYAWGPGIPYEEHVEKQVDELALDLGKLIEENMLDDYEWII